MYVLCWYVRARTHARTHARRTITTTTAPSEEDEHVRNFNEKYQNMLQQFARTTRCRNKRKSARGDQGKKQNRAKTLEIHKKITISTTRRTRRTAPRRRRQNPEVWKGRKTADFLSCPMSKYEHFGSPEAPGPFGVVFGPAQPGPDRWVARAAPRGRPTE